MGTNIRQTRWKQCHWELLGHGAAMAASALALEKRFSRVLLPATSDTGLLHPWGSHPLSDPLFSTSKTRIVHDGVTYTRTEKTEFISQNALVLRTLHVCFRGQDGLGQDDTNCCRCEKCFRTMVTLEILGKLDKAALFDRQKFDVRKISRILAETTLKINYYSDIRAFALKHGRTDIAREIDRCFRRSRRIARWLFVSQFLSHLPFLWRLGVAIGHRAVRGSFR